WPDRPTPSRSSRKARAGARRGRLTPVILGLSETSVKRCGARFRERRRSPPGAGAPFSMISRPDAPVIFLITGKLDFHAQPT
ncbi:MAG: hypothetical protein ACRD3R_10685, partial [Terriglobales bacterium]